MKFLPILFSTFLILALIPSVSALSGWSYRGDITVEYTGTSDLTHYQYNFTLDTASLVSAGKMQADGGDFRITDINNNLLPFYNITNFNDANTKIWVNATSVDHTSANTTHYYYIGTEGTSTTTADADSTFYLYDNFSGTSMDTDRWETFGVPCGVTVSGGEITLSPPFTNDHASGLYSKNTVLSNQSIIEWRGQTIGANNNANMGISDSHDGSTVIYSDDCIDFAHWQDGSRYRRLIDASQTYISLTKTEAYHVHKIYNNGTNLKFYQDENYRGVLTSSPEFDTNMYFFAVGYSTSFYNGDIKIDWVMNRAYVANGPEITVGSEYGTFIPPVITYEKGLLDDGEGYVYFDWEPNPDSIYQTDSYNYSISGDPWVNGTSATSLYFPAPYLEWANLIIHCYNSTYGTSNAATENQQIPPPLPAIPTLISPADNYVLKNDQNITLEYSTTGHDSAAFPLIYYVFDNNVLIHIDSEANESYVYDTGGNYTHEWKVCAGHGYGNSSYSTLRSFTVLQVPELLSPGNHSTHNFEYPPATHSIDLSWSDFGAPSYRMIIARDSGFIQVVSDAYYTVAGTTKILTADKYYWKVATYNGDVENHSNFSSTADFNITETTPSLGTGIQGVVYDKNDMSISGAVVTMWNTTYSDSYITGTNGYYVFTDGILPGNYSLQATNNEYDNSIIYMVYIIQDATTDRNIYMDDLQGEYDWHHYVSFTVQSIWGTKYADIDVKIYLPGSASLCLTGTTDTTGQVVFHLDEDIKYRITFESPAITNKEINIYPHQTHYYIIVSYDDSVFDDDLIESNIIQNGVDWYVGENGSVDIYHTNTNDDTTALNFTIKERLVNGSFITIDTYDSFGNLSQGSHRFVLTGYADKEYVIYINYTTDTYGELSRTYGISYGNTITVLNDIFNPFVRGFLSLFIILAVGMIASPTNREIVALLTSITAALLHSAHWLDYFGVSPLLVWSGISLAIIVSIGALFNKGSKEDGV